MVKKTVSLSLMRHQKMHLISLPVPEKEVQSRIITAVMKLRIHLNIRNGTAGSILLQIQK